MTPDLSFFQAKNIIVTGGAGFIGSHLCERLLELGATVWAVDNLVTGNRNNVASFAEKFAGKFYLIEADVTQPVGSYLPLEILPDAVFHMASPASPPLYQAHPVETYLVNSYATHLLLSELRRRAPAARFLFASTSEIYGDPQVHPQTEDYWGNVNPNGVRSCYDEAKRLGETICGVHARDFTMDVRIIRIFNTYGPRMDLADGRVIPNFIRAVLENKPLQIYGTGQQTRSFCYVADLVDGILRFMAADSGAGETINLGNPSEFTIAEAAEVVKKSVDQNYPIEFKPLPQDDPQRRRPDITKAQRLLNWLPQVAFADGFAKTLASYRSYPR